MSLLDDYEDYLDFNVTGDYTLPPIPINPRPEIQPIQIVTLLFYGLVFLLGVPGNAVVVWVTGFCMPRSVTSLWFLNLALADLLCCLSLPLLMVPLAHDDHWHFGPLACTLLKALFHLVMYCSVLQLVVISVDRWMLVSRPIWCQNNRLHRRAVGLCVAVWCLALVGSIPQFVYTRQINAGRDKRECGTAHSALSGWLVTSFHFVVGFFLPFAVIVACHLVVYTRAERGLSRGRTRSSRTLRVVCAVVVSFFLCLLPLHTLDLLLLAVPRISPHRPGLYLAQTMALCLAYFNSCLNPLLYVCLGRGFKQSMNRSVRGLLHFISEDPASRVSVATNETKSTSNGKAVTKM